MNAQTLDKIERWGKLLRDVGFPILVALYLLARFDILLREHTQAMWALTIAVNSLIAKH